MSRTQRIVLLGLAAVVLVVGIVLATSGGDDDENAGSAQTQTQSAAPPADADQDGSSTEAPAEQEPAVPLLQAGKEQELEYKKGDTVRFRVRHPSAEEVHVHGYDIMRDLEPGKTVTISFEADLEGIFEVELEKSGTPIATLKVEPR